MAGVWKCSGCGANIEASTRQKSVCPYCGTVNAREKHEIKQGYIECVQCGAQSQKDSKFCAACGSELYFTCPKCGKLNLAESVHCPQCGANIAQEIKNWQIKQAQEQEKKAEKRKRTKKVLLAIMIPVSIIMMLFVVAFVISEVQESQEYAARTATASAYNATTPYKWTSDSGELEVIVQPVIYIAESGTFFVDLLYSNKSYQKCEFNEYQTYIMDDLGNTYVDTFADTAKDAFTGSYEPDLETVEPYTSEFLSVQSNHPLPDSVKKLIIYPSQFCGESVDPITVDLNSPWIKHHYWD